jgi:hypothetical protein
LFDLYKISLSLSRGGFKIEGMAHARRVMQGRAASGATGDVARA